MNLTKRKKSIADVLVILAVFCVFALTAIFVILFGARIYQNDVERIDNNYLERTVPLYITAKIRSFDEGNVFVTDYEGTDILTMQSEKNGTAFNTYVYACNSSLCEYTGKAEDGFNPEFGTKIFNIANLSVQKMNDSLFRFTVLQNNGSAYDFYTDIKTENGGAFYEK